MGTRSLTFVKQTYKDKEGKEKKQTLCCMYRQFDGYPSGHGTELAEFLAKGKLVNGLGNDRGIVFNGAGCLAATMVSHFKGNKAGGFYLYATNTNDAWQDYIYDIIVDADGLKLELVCYGSTRKRKLFKGTPKEFIEWAKKH